MVPKSIFAAILCAVSLAFGGAAMADQYRPAEFLGLDLPAAVLSPKRLGPETEFARVPIEARSDRVQADPEASVWPKLPAHDKPVAKPRIAKPQMARTSIEPRRAAARAKLAHRRGNPLDAQASDTRVQTWPCKSGGICNWQR